MSMTRTQLVAFVKRRIGDPHGTQFSDDNDLVVELNEAVNDLALDAELDSILWRMHRRETINVDQSVREYPIGTLNGAPYLLTRKVVRADLVQTPLCTRIEPEELEAYANTDGLNDQSGLFYAIGPMENGKDGLLLPARPPVGAQLVHHYMREPEALATAGSTPDGIPGPYHRIVGLRAAMRLLGADNANTAAYIAIQNEHAMLREQMMAVLGRNYAPEEIEDVTEYG